MNLIKGLKRQWLLVAMVLAVYCQFSANPYLLNVSKSGIWFAFVFNGFVLPLMYLGLTCFFLYTYYRVKTVLDSGVDADEINAVRKIFKKRCESDSDYLIQYQNFKVKINKAGEIDYIGRVLSILLLVGLAISPHTFIAAWTIAAYLGMVVCTMVIKNTSKEFFAIAEKYKLNEIADELHQEVCQNNPETCKIS